MSSVDSRIVTAKFDNKQFEEGAAQTMSTLDKLKQMLSFPNAGKGLQDMQSAVNKFHLNPMTDAIQGVSKAWLGLAGVALSVINRITNAAIDAGKKAIAGFTGPISDGFHEYETTLNSIQTVLANTGLRGSKGLDKVNNALENLNKFSDKTIYNFSQMASNVGTFTAAGVKLKTSVASIKGIADIAALSGANATQAATGMYQLSQAIATGTVRLQDWLSVEHAGFGGKIFQDALKRTARQHGVAIDAMIKKNGSFRASLQENWLSSAILTDTLKQFTGDLTDAQLKSQGYTDKQIKKIQRLAKTANDAATKVKTFSQLIGTLKEASGSGWAQSFSIIVGNFNEAKTMFTQVNDVLGGFIQRSAEARNKVLKDWKALGGRTLLIDSIKNAFHAVLDILKPIKDAFREIFPPKTGKDLYDLTVSLHNFTEGLKVSKDTQAGIKSTFAGLFAVWKIGVTIFTGLVKLFFSLFSLFKGEGSGSVLTLTGNFGDMLVALEKWLVEGGKIDAFFGKIKAALGVLAPVVQLFFNLAGAVQTLISSGAQAFFEALKSAFSGTGSIVENVVTQFQSLGDSIKGLLTGLGLGGIFDAFNTGADKAATGIDKVNTAFDESKTVAGQVAGVFGGLLGVFAKIGSFFKSIGQGIRDAFGFIKDAVSGLGDTSGEGLSNTLAVINTGFLTALYIAIRGFVKNVGGTFAELRGTFKSAKGVLNQMTDNLKTMQTEVKAKAIMEIAIAVALLAGAIFLLSKTDPVGLAAGLAAVVVLIKVMVTAIKDLEKEMQGVKASAEIAIISAAMVGMALAIVALAGAVALLGNMDTATLAKGLTSVALIMAIIVGATTLLEKSGGGSQMVAAAVAIGILAAALTMFAGALLLYAALDTKTMAEGGLKAAAAIVAIGIAMRAMPKDMLASAASLLIVAAALIGIAGALRVLGGMSVKDLAKGVITLAIALDLITTTMIAMQGTAGGAAALLLVALAIASLIPSLVILGSLDMKTIGKSLLALTGIFAAIAIGAALLEPVAPVLLALAGAVALLGLGVALVGAGLLAFSIGLATLAASGAAGIAVLTAGVIAMAELFPLIMFQFGLGIKALAVAISTAGPQLVAAFSTVLGSLIQAVIINTPKLAKMLMVLLDNALKVLVHAIPRMVVAGIKIIGGILRGIRDNIPQMVKVGGEVIVAWIVGIGKQVKKIADAAAKLIIDFINGISEAINNNAEALGAAGANLAVNIVKGIVKGIAGGIPLVVDAAKKLAKGALDAAKHFLGIESPSKEFEKLGKFVDLGFAKGIVGGLDHVQEAMNKMKDMIKASIDANKSQVEDLKGQLKDLMEHPAKNAEEIEKVNKALDDSEAKLKKSKAARDVYRKDLADEEAALRSLGKQYDDYQDQLTDAKDELKRLQDERLSFIAGIEGKVGGLPEIDKDTSLDTYLTAVDQQEKDVEKFHESLNTLSQMGLSDAAYQKLLDEGPGIQPFLDELTAAGPNAVGAINGVTQKLGDAAHSLGLDAALKMKQVGIDAAQGIVDGLEQSIGAVEAQMTEIARAMVKAIKKELKSHSPSKVMDEIGQDTNEGLSNGLDKTAKMVAQSATNVAAGAVDAIKSTLDGISTAVMTDVNTNPTITPVLDLTQVTKDAGALNKMLETQPVATISTGQAVSISNDKLAQLADAVAASASETKPALTFEQHNHSPKALSTTDIYRDTKNLFSLAKEALK